MCVIYFSAGTGSEYSDAGRYFVRSILRYRVRNEGPRYCTSPITAHSGRLDRGCRRFFPDARLSPPDYQTVAQPHRNLVRRRLAPGQSMTPAH